MSIVDTVTAKGATDEVRHANIELEYFYLEARRNKKIAEWAAKKLGIDAETYFLELISADLSKAGPKPVIDRIVVDFKENDIDISEEKIWKKLRKIEQTILEAMLKEQAKRTKAEVKKKKNK